MADTGDAARAEFETDRDFARQVSSCLEQAGELARKYREIQSSIVYLIRDVEKWQERSADQIVRVGMVTRADGMLRRMMEDLIKALTGEHLQAVTPAPVVSSHDIGGESGGA